MKRFDSKGRIYVPEQYRCDENLDDLVVFKECYCENGHNLVSKRVKFGKCNGIWLKIQGEKGDGFIAVSPVWGDKTRVTIDLDLINHELVQLFCPECDVKLPKYSNCKCGGDMVTIFLDNAANYSHCVGVCNRIGCPHSEIKNSDELFYFSRSL